MITNEQKNIIKEKARKIRFIKRKNRYVIRNLHYTYLLEPFDNDFKFDKYIKLKNETEDLEWD